MAELITGAVLGAVCGELLRHVVKATKTAASFSDVLKEVESTLSSIQLIIEDIESFNKKIDKVQEKQLIEIIHEGQELVTKCSKIKRGNFLKKNRYTRKLNRFMKSLERFCQIVMQIQQMKDTINVPYEVKGVSMEVRRFNSREGSGSHNGMYIQVAVVGSSKVPEPPGKVIGFDVPLKELKMKLFKDGVSVIVVFALGGSGKTTLVKVLRRDEEVKGVISCALADEESDTATIRPLSRPTQSVTTTNIGDEANSLFRHSAFQQNGNPYIPEDLVTKDVAVWQSRAKLRLFCLKCSLDALDQGSFPEDHMIPATALVDMLVEQYKLDEDDAIVNLLELSTWNHVYLTNCCFLTREYASEADGCYNDHSIMQQDLLRELGIYQSSLDPLKKRKRLTREVSSNKFPNWWLEKKQQPLGARFLSVSADETFSFNWGNIQAPEDVLVLNFWTKNYTLPVFMGKMHRLKVLIVMNSGVYPTELSNFLLQFSLSNLKRIKPEKVSVPSLSMNSLHLKNLPKISCDDLEELTCGLCDLVQLMKLSISNCHKLRSHIS
ncbi:hypothetical protein DITRI_Ditri18aG0096200 [Diplodiscus trichospermus]